MTKSVKSIALVGFDKDVLCDIKLHGISVFGYFAIEDKKNGFSYLGNEDCIKDIPVDVDIIVTVDNCEFRKYIFEKYPQKLSTYISSSAIISSTASIGRGVLIMPKAFISENVKIGNCCKINVDANIHHDSFVGNYSICAPRSTLLGKVKVGEGVYIGSASIIRNDISIGDNVVIGMGSAVVQGVGSNMTLFGNPARVVKSKI